MIEDKKKKPKYKDDDSFTAIHQQIILMFTKQEYISFDKISKQSELRFGMTRASFMNVLTFLKRKGILEKINTQPYKHKYKLIMTFKEIEEKFGLIFLPDLMTEDSIQIPIIEEIEKEDIINEK